MSAVCSLENVRESLVAELAEVSDAAYRAALGHGVRGSFLDLELGLWRALQRAVTLPGAGPRPR